MSVSEKCFVSDSDGCIYKEGTRSECEAFLSTASSEILDFLPRMMIYKEKEWIRIFGTTEF